MADLWGGRFTKETDETAWRYNASISFDKRLIAQDIEGSIAHATMLGRQSIITDEEKDVIVRGLNMILAEVKSGELTVDETRYEDVHSFVEARLIEKIGDAGKKLHTARSRNDQVALDMRLYARESAQETSASLCELLEAINDMMKAHTQTVMPGFTHLQKAQPVTLAHHLGAYFEMFRRDNDRCLDLMQRMNECPLGAGALAGTTYPIDRDYTSRLLRFDHPTRNSMDTVSDRDYLIEYLFALSLIMTHLSRLSEEIILWNSDEYRFVEIDDAYATGSSIMPQKKNPDVAELMRGKTGRVYGALTGLLTTMKGLPLAYDKDMQEDKERVFDAADTVNMSLRLARGMLTTLKFDKARMEESAARGFSNATDVADYLVTKGVAFRDAHGIVGKIVLSCIDKGCAIDALSIDEFKMFSDAFDEDVYEKINVRACVDRRTSKGGPSPLAVAKEIEENEAYLHKVWVR